MWGFDGWTSFENRLWSFWFFHSNKWRNSNRYNHRSINQIPKSESDAKIHAMIQWLVICFIRFDDLHVEGKCDTYYDIIPFAKGEQTQPYTIFVWFSHNVSLSNIFNTFPNRVINAWNRKPYFLTADGAKSRYKPRQNVRQKWNIISVDFLLLGGIWIFMNL